MKIRFFPIIMILAFIFYSCPTGIDYIPVKSLNIVAEASVEVGDTITLLATVLPDNATNKKLIWTTENPSIATVDQYGKVSGIAVGSTGIVVTTEDKVITYPSQQGLSIRINLTVTESDSFTLALRPIKTYLLEHSSGENIDDPVKLVVEMDLGNLAKMDFGDFDALKNNGWERLLNLIYDIGKFVEIDLSNCTLLNNEFRTSSWYTGNTRATEYIVSLVLPETATSIAEGTSPYRFSNMKSVSGKNITYIGSWAFNSCKNLNSVDFPQVTSIGKLAFSGCINLNNINLPKLTEICDSAFSGCANLSTVFFPLLKSIGGWGFSECTNLNNINFPLITSIGDRGFQSCINLSEVNFPLLSSIGNSVFTLCTSLTSVSIPLLAEINRGTFWGCSSLINVNIPQAISIGEGAFFECININMITIGQNCDINNESYLPHNFKSFYDEDNSNGIRIAGVYTFNGTNWNWTTLP